MFRIIAKSLKTGILTEREPFTARPAVRFPGDRLRQVHRLRRVRRRVPHGGDPGVRGGPGSAEAVAFLRCLHPVPGVRHRLPGAGGVRRPRLRGRSLHARPAHAHRPVRNRRRLAGRLSARSKPSPVPGSANPRRRLRERIRGRLGRSLHVRQVDAGSCNGCELEIAATTNPVFDLERFGIHFVASPRHADLLLVTGPVTRNMEIALRRTYEATAEPRVVVAVGACGCSGGNFRRGHLRGRRRRRPRRARGRLRPRVSAPAPSDPQRPAGRHGSARSTPEARRARHLA